MIDLPGVRTPEADVLRRGLRLWAETSKLHLVDAYLTALAESTGRGVSSSDAGIRKSGLVPVLDPVDLLDK